MSYLDDDNKINSEEIYLIDQLCLNIDSNESLRPVITLQINTEDNTGVFFELSEH